MATARPGWSRRAQYGLFFSFLAVIAGHRHRARPAALSLRRARDSSSEIRGAALDVTGPVAGALHEVTATVEGLVTGAGNYWDAASQNGELKRERKAMLQRMVEAQGDLPGEPAAQGRAPASRSTSATRSRSAGSSARRSTARAASPSSRQARSDGVRVGMPVRSADGLVGRIIDAGALASRVLLVSDRANIVPARLLRERHSGDCPRPRRRHDRRPPARSRPQSVQARRHHHHLGHRRALSAAGADRPRREARRRRRDRASARRSGDDQLRDRRAAVTSRPPSPPRTPAAATTRPDGPRRALAAEARYRPGPDAASRGYVPAATVVAASLLAALPIVSTSGWFPDFGYPRADQLAAASRRSRGRPGGPLRWASSTTCSPDIR